jgi:hypothetical protein
MVLRLLICIFLLQGCFPQKAQKPEDVLREFIIYRFSMGQTKDKLLDFTAGDMRAKIERLDDEQLKRFNNVGMYKFKNFKVVLKSCNNTVCSITYILSYNKIEKDKPSLLNEIKKIAEMEQINGSWKVKDVATVKTYFESVVPLEAP